MILDVMPIYGARGGFLSTADWQDLERKIVNGDGFGWPGDPRMELRIGVLKETATGKEGHRLEVWRWNEDGSETRIAHWLPREAHMVCYELAQMRRDSPGYVSAEEQIDAHNEAVEEAALRQFRETYAEMLEYGNELFLERAEGKRKHFFAGSPLVIPGRNT